jgi:hypothetical protein
MDIDMNEDKYTLKTFLLWIKMEGEEEALTVLKKLGCKDVRVARLFSAKRCYINIRATRDQILKLEIKNPKWLIKISKGNPISRLV